jgi:glycerophosphoryl diester phosphodiesterase/HEAT repeat protein
MKRVCVALFVVTTATAIQAGALQPGRVELLCHRTANEDVPENTLESLEQAALLGCNVVEIDLRKTLDGKIVLNHDGVLERLTDGVGDPEKTYYDDLRLLDAGTWMGERFSGMRITLFEDALRLARERDVRLILDIKTKGIGVDVLELLQREGMLKRVQFNGEWVDVKQLYPAATDAGDGTKWVQPGVTAEEVKTYHEQGNAVVANFSANAHEMDLAAMKAAVAAGVDGINVDFPRLGADAVGRPVERSLNALEVKASAGESGVRSAAILELSRYRGFPLQTEFERLLLDADDHVSRAAALALVTSRPHAPASAFSEAMRSEHADVRANAAWALGIISASVSDLLPLLKDQDPQVLQQALLAISRVSGDVDSQMLLPILIQGDVKVRGEAALALARHNPEVALKAIPVQLRLEMKAAVRLGDDYERRGKPQLTQAEIDEIMGYFRCQMKMVQAMSMLKGAGAMQALEELAFRPGEDSAQFDSIVAAFQLWDRIGLDALPAVQALGSTDIQVQDRAEWMLVQGGPAVLPDVRKALGSENVTVRERAIRIVAWQGDKDSLGTLRAMQKTDVANAISAAWAIKKIESLHPAP